MQYYQFMIHAHRPWISKHYIQPQPPQGPGSSHARKACIDSAIAIVKILMLYERLYGFRKTNVHIVSFTFSAALILIFTTVPAQSGRRNEEHVKYLSTCFWALEEMGGCFESAKRTSTFLSTLQQQWHKRKRGAPAHGVKRGPENLSRSGKDRKMRRKSPGVMEETESRHISGASPAPSTIGPSIESWGQGFSIAGEEALDVVDFMDPELCNILLSEGIPRELV
ncbi:hypothetical protein N7492_005451 [Penicillium capsulatum]|uniref:Fungal specific transcription factor n=1 Tax=Penicillium capsulatum TaxID=69766 RepID=A0A9W9IBY2_9EURO|nr:hypothetical protein N7492_005451 [Penicillium capsulatum]